MHPVTLRFADPVLERHDRDARLRLLRGLLNEPRLPARWPGSTFIVIDALVDREPC